MRSGILVDKIAYSCSVSVASSLRAQGGNLADKPPRSYRNRRRPALDDALRMEGNVTLDAATKSLVRKGYFTPPPRPWSAGVRDRGLGRYSYAVLDRFGDVVVTGVKEVVEFIVDAANAYKPRRTRSK